MMIRSRLVVPLGILALAALSLAITGCPPPPPPTATVDIQYDPAPDHEVSPLLYGGFIEFLGGVINGRSGVWAQELFDRGFDWPDDDGDGVSDGLATVAKAAWVPVVSGGNSGSWALAEGGYNTRGVYAQGVTIDAYTDGSRGVAQDGIPLRPDVSYELYVYLRGEAIEGAATVSLADATTGAILDETAFTGVSGEWTRFEAILTPGVSHGGARFSISIAEEGTLWIDEASLMAEDHEDGARAAYVEKGLMLQPGPLRYPGGCFADGAGNHFTNGIGPVDQRPPNWDNHWGAWQRMDFGFDEYMAFCGRTGMSPQITVNFGSGTAGEAADWVEYANGDASTPYGALRAGNGHPEPYGVTLWEVGNEQYGEWEIGHTTPEDYAGQFIDFANQMRARDPDIRVMADGGLNADWTRPILEIAGPYMDYLTVHMTAPNLNLAPLDSEKVFRAMMAAPLAKESTLREIQDGIDLLGLTGQVRVGVGEWWVTYSYPGSGAQRAASLESALYTAGMLNTFQRTADIVDFANRTTFIAVLQTALEPYPVLYGTPTFWVLSMFASLSGTMPVEAEVTSSTYDSQAVGNIPAMTSVPYLDVSVTSDGDRLVVMAVNRHPSQAIDTTLNVSGCSVAADGVAHTLASEDYLDTNADPPHDRIMPADTALTGLSPSFSYPFPAHSLTCLELGME